MKKVTKKLKLNKASVSNLLIGNVLGGASSINTEDKICNGIYLTITCDDVCVNKIDIVTNNQTVIQVIKKR